MISDSRHESNNRWKERHSREERGSHLHKPTVEKLQHESRVKHAKNAKADQYAIDNLRPTSGIPSRKISYQENLSSFGSPRALVDRPSKKPRLVDDTFAPSRLDAIKGRLAERKPTRYSIESWKEFRKDSLAFLQPFYPDTNLSFSIDWIEKNSKPPGAKPLSALRILNSLKESFPNTEIMTPEEMSDLMKALGFKWGHLHSSYYIRISRRLDVISHRHDSIPILHELMTNKKYYYANYDWSFEYENDISKSAWISLAQEGSDLVDSKPGKGRRFAFCEFMTPTGILRHPDGKSAGTILTSNQTLGSDDILRTIRRGFEAISNQPEVKSGKRIPVLHLARNQTTKEPDYINPNEMNLSDGGSNRVLMDHIGTKGLQKVLSENGQWLEGMRLAEARDRMWASNMVRDQQCQIENLGLEFGIIVIFNPKAHPWLAFIEQFWRWMKDKLQNLLNMSEISKRYNLLLVDFMNGTEWAVAKCQKWFHLSLKYVEYYSRGGVDMVKDRKMRALDLSTMNRMTPKPKFQSVEEARQAAHRANFVLFRGKQYQHVELYW